MNPPRIVKDLTRSARVALHPAKDDTFQSKVTAGFQHYFMKLITPEGQNETHVYLFVEPEFKMHGRKSLDATIQVSIGGESCPSRDVFGALFHESKPDAVKRKRSRNGKVKRYLKPWIEVSGAVQAAGKQVVGRLVNGPHWRIVKRMEWNGVYASSGIGRMCALIRRKGDDGLVYHIYREPDDPTLRERLLIRIQGIGHQFLKSYWTPIEGDDFFSTAYSSAGEDIMDQVLEREEQIMQQHAGN